MNRIALGLVVCALALAVVGWRWLATSEGTRELDTAAAPQARAEFDAARGLGIHAPGLETSAANSIAPAQSQLATRAAAQEPAAEPVPEPATLIVRVVDKRNARGLAALVVSIDSLEGTRTITDLEGVARLQLPSNVEWRLRVRPNEYHNVYEQRSVPALAPGERRELVVEASLMERESFFARVLDQQTRRPVPQARVFVGSEAAALAGSDAEGVFDIPISAERAVFLRVSAPGYAEASLATRPGCDSRAQACEILLVRSAGLSVRLEGQALDGWPSYRVSCGGLLQRGSSGPIALQLGSLAAPTSKSWPCDEQGFVRIEGLPADQALVVRVSHGGKQLPLQLPSLQLSPGESRELVVDLDAGCVLRGRTLDPSGVPVGRVSIWLMSWMPNSSPVAGFLDARRVCASATSDDDGRFVFEGVVPGAWQLSPAAGELQPVGELRLGNFEGNTRLIFDRSARRPGAETASPAHADAAAWIQDIVVPPGSRSFDVELVVHCGRYIKGRVVDAQGEPAQAVSVFACDGGERARADTHAGGEFTLGPLGPGEFKLWARDVFNSRGFAAPQAAAVGASEVLLELRPAGKLQLLYSGAAATAEYCVLQDGVEVANGSLTRGVGLRLSLPQGLLRVEFMPERSGAKYVREIENSADEALELRLRDGE